MIGLSDRKLRERLDVLVSRAEKERITITLRRHEYDAEANAFQTQFDTVLVALRNTILDPKLAALVSLFTPETANVMKDPYGYTLRLRPVNRFNVPATVSIEVRPDLSKRCAIATFSVLITPILTDYGRGRSLEIKLDADGREALSVFVDQRIECFICDYLAMHTPDSPYQKDALVTDPVCGMVFPRAEAAASVMSAGVTVYFCNEDCRDLFATEPARYARRNGSHDREVPRVFGPVAPHSEQEHLMDEKGSI